MCSWTTQPQMSIRTRKGQRWVVSSEEMVIFTLVLMPCLWLPYDTLEPSSFESKGEESVGEMSHEP